MKENQYLEFKREYTSDIKKEVIAFANSSGGVIHIGVDNDGRTYPIADTDAVISQLTNAVRDSILPDVTMFLDYEATQSSIKVIVQEGTNKPYYLADKGLKPSGVYVRQGASSVPASQEQIRKMIKDTDGDSFEVSRSLVQVLTFNTLTDEFTKQGIDIGATQQRSLGIISNDGLYSNLGLLLSDQCIHSLKIAVFNGTQMGEFKTRKELEGSLLKQLREAFDFFSLTNNLSATFSGLDRIERYDYPEEAIREAMLNAVIHRDYSLSGSTIIRIYDDRMEFASLGGLVSGLSKEDLFLGISQPRNEKLANVFYRLKLIEAYGTGIKKIIQLYADVPVKPTIEVTPNGFMLTLPNINYALRHAEPTKHSKQTVIILDYLREHSVITNEIVQNLLNVKQTRAYSVIKSMLNSGLIRKSNDENGEYVLND